MSQAISTQLLSTAAVVVTYRPDLSVVANLTQLRGQVAAIIVVDNGSGMEPLAWLREAAQRLDVVLLENERNLGIATALNLGVAHALSRGFEYLFLFDQDSCVTEGFVLSMLTAAKESPWADRLGILVPRYLDLRDGRLLHPKVLAGHGLEEAITSGSLLRSSTLRQIGPFADDLFIDGVDHEISLRVRRAGMVIDECSSAVLRHSPGTPSEHVVFGKRFQTSNYSPVRRYYQERSKVWIARRYFTSFPGFCSRLLLSSLKDGIKVAIVESGSLEKLRFGLRGIADGLRNHMGEYRARG